MARGALVNNETNIVTAVLEAASELNTQYNYDTVVWYSFVPDALANVGDTYDPKTGTFTYTSVPQAVTALQARQALNAAGLRSQVEAAITAASQDIKDMWQFSPTINRQDANLIALATSIGMNSAELDGLFQAASLFTA